MNKIWLPASVYNYTKGRGKAIKYVTIHHMAGTPATLQYLWQNPSRNASSHYGVFPDKVEQYVAESDTAWCNGNWNSNQESISIENWGDWRGGWTNGDVLANLKELLRDIRTRYPGININFHNDISTTACPAELRGHAMVIWDQLTAEFTTPPKPNKPNISYERITPTKYIFNKHATLWDFNFSQWSSAKPATDKIYPSGEVIDIVAIATNPVGAKYGMTAYSYDDGKIRANNGFNMADLSLYIESNVTKPTEPANGQLEPNTPIDIPTVEQPNEPVVVPEQPILDETTLTPTSPIKQNLITQFITKIKELLYAILKIKN